MVINMLVLSDIHLGHAVNKTEDMVQNLRRFLLTYKNDLQKTNLLIISGDVFDKLLTNNSADFHLAYEWLTELLLICDKYGIILRILEGTPSHDWKQVKLLYNTIKNLKLDLNFRYFEELDIEYIDDLGINVLYLPDEWKTTNIEIYEDVKKKMEEHDLNKVDIIVMHGAFNYQLPEFLTNLHDPELYSGLAYGPIITGHIHNRSMYKNIIVPGSFERLSHSDDGEEKGGLLLNYNTENHKWNFKYLNNKHALEFYTFDVSGKEISYIKKLLDKYKKDKKVYIRFIVGENNLLRESILDLKKLYSNIILNIVKEKKEEKDEKLIKSEIKIKTSKLDKDFILGYISEKVATDEYSIYKDEINIIEKLT